MILLFFSDFEGSPENPLGRRSSDAFFGVRKVAKMTTFSLLFHEFHENQGKQPFCHILTGGDTDSGPNSRRHGGS